MEWALDDYLRMLDLEEELEKELESMEEKFEWTKMPVYGYLYAQGRKYFLASPLGYYNQYSKTYRFAVIPAEVFDVDEIGEKLYSYPRVIQINGDFVKELIYYHAAVRAYNQAAEYKIRVWDNPEND